MHTPQPLVHLLRRRTNTNPLLTRQAQLTRKSTMRLPACAFHGTDFLQHLIDLLQAETFHLWDEEECEDDGQDTERAPQEEDFGAKIGVSLAGADEVRCDDGLGVVSKYSGLGVVYRLTMIQFQNQLLAVESPTPRARIGKGKISPTTGMKVSLCAIRSYRLGQKLTNPSRRPPSHGECRDVQADERNHRLDCLWVLSIRHTNNGDDILGDDHKATTKEQDLAASKLLDDVEGDRRGAYVDKGRDQLDQERIRDGSELVEEHNTCDRVRVHVT